MLLDRLLAEERDRIDVLNRRARDARGHPALPGVAKHDELVAAERNRTEEAGLRVRHGLDLLRRELVPEDVRRARVVRAAVQKLAVRREDEAVGHARAEVEVVVGRRVARTELRGRDHADVLLAVDLAERRRQERPVRRHVQVVHDRAVRKRDDLLPVVVGRRQRDERAEAVEMPDAPQRAIRAREDEVADARVLHQHAPLARLHVERDEIAVGEVVRRVEERRPGRIHRERRHLVDQRPLDVRQMRRRPAVRRDRAHVRDDPGVVERRVDRVRRGIVVRARDRAERARREIACTA